MTALWIKAKGKRLTTFVIDTITEIEPVDIPQPEVDKPDEADSTDETDESIERSDDEVRDELTGQQRIF